MMMILTFCLGVTAELSALLSKRAFVYSAALFDQGFTLA